MTGDQCSIVRECHPLLYLPLFRKVNSKRGVKGNLTQQKRAV